MNDLRQYQMHGVQWSEASEIDLCFWKLCMMSLVGNTLTLGYSWLRILNGEALKSVRGIVWRGYQTAATLSMHIIIQICHKVTTPSWRRYFLKLFPFMAQWPTDSYFIYFIFMRFILPVIKNMLWISYYFKGQSINEGQAQTKKQLSKET